MVILTLVVVLVLSCHILACEIQSPLPCNVHFGYVYFTFSNLAHVSKEDKKNLVFKTTNVNDNRTQNYPSLETGYYDVDFRLWDVEEVSEGTEYELRLGYKNNDKVLWNYSNNTFKLRQDLFYCYYKKTPGDRRPRAFGFTDTSMGVQWDINFWDQEYKFIQYHEVSAEENGVEVFREKLTDENCQQKMCSSMISGIEPCREYKVCVSTKFIKSTCVAVECITVKTPSCVNSAPIDYIVIASAGGIFLLVMLISVMICQRLRRKRHVAEDENETEEIIEPRDRHHYYEIPNVAAEHDYVRAGHEYNCQIHHIL